MLTSAAWCTDRSVTPVCNNSLDLYSDTSCLLLLSCLELCCDYQLFQTPLNRVLCVYDFKCTVGVRYKVGIRAGLTVGNPCYWPMLSLVFVKTILKPTNYLWKLWVGFFLLLTWYRSDSESPYLVLISKVLLSLMVFQNLGPSWVDRFWTSWPSVEF